MKVIRNNRPIPVDVDGTLIIHQPPNTIPLGEELDIFDPIENAWIRVRKNLPMIRILKEEFSRGSFLVVWSRGGHAWAESVIQALKLESYIALVMDKPLVYFDDIEISDWLKDRVFLGPETVYKTIITKE